MTTFNPLRQLEMHPESLTSWRSIDVFVKLNSNPKAMKVLSMLMISVILPFAMHAQLKPKPYISEIKSFRIHPLPNLTNPSIPFLKSQITSPIIINPHFNRTGVSILPLDKMPCITTTIASNMPVINGLDFSIYKPVPIPNGVFEIFKISSLITD